MTRTTTPHAPGSFALVTIMLSHGPLDGEVREVAPSLAELVLASPDGRVRCRYARLTRTPRIFEYVGEV